MGIKHSDIHQIKKIAKQKHIKGIHDISCDTEENEHEFTFKDWMDKWYVINLKTKEVYFA